MSTATVPTTHDPRTYGNWRKPTSPGIGSLGLAGTFILLGGIVCAVLAAMVLWQLSIAIVVLCGLVLAPMAVHDHLGRNGFQWVMPRLAFRRGVAAGQHLYRSGPLSRIPQGTCPLPGLAATITAAEAKDAWGRPFVLLHHRGAGHVTAVIETSPDGAALVDIAEVDNRVAHWGAWLASLAYEPALRAASVTIETAPDLGSRLRSEVTSHQVEGAPPLAAQVLDQIVDTYPAGSAAINCRIALTWSTSPRSGTGARRSPEEMAIDIGHRLPNLTRSLGATGAGPARPMATAELAAALRLAYDPAAHAAVDQAGPQASGISWANAGPMATEEHWDSYRHDSGMSVSWAMAEAPSGHVFSGVLDGLLAPHPDIVRKRVTLLYRPHSPASATKIVERDRLDASFAASAHKVGRARDRVSQTAADKSAAEEAEGAGVVRFGLIATATVLSTSTATAADLELAAIAMENLATTARITLRRAYGSQASTFLAGLPLGLVLPHHLRVPQALREML